MNQLALFPDPIGRRVERYSESIELGDGENHLALWEFLAMLTCLQCWMGAPNLEELAFATCGNEMRMPRVKRAERRAA